MDQYTIPFFNYLAFFLFLSLSFLKKIEKRLRTH